MTHSWRICSFQLTLTFSKLQLNLPEALAKSGRGSVLIPRDSPTHGQRGRCPRFAAAPPSPDGRIACVRPVAQNENSIQNDSLAFDETENQ